MDDPVIDVKSQGWNRGTIHNHPFESYRAKILTNKTLHVVKNSTMSKYFYRDEVYSLITAMAMNATE